MTNLTSTSLIHRAQHSTSPPVQSLRFGLIGAGSIGRHHARVLSQLVGIQLVGVCDLDKIRGQEVCQQVGASHFETSAELLDNCDAVVIATPTASHYDLALQAIQSGKHVLVEKPLADSVERARHRLAQSRIHAAFNVSVVMLSDSIPW
ncbi:MAG: Gfo/Idh/MocA family oxidoreductase [Pirellulales bacterium]